MKKLRTDLRENLVNAIEELADQLIHTGNEDKMTQFCNYCRTNGHLPSCCRNANRDQELKGTEVDGTAEKKCYFLSRL